MNEEEYFPETKRKRRTERKIASRKDRSKDKKTDREKRELLRATAAKKRLAKKEELFKGRVLSLTPEGFMIDSDGEVIFCVLRGVLKKEILRTKNLVTVGDWVLFEKETAAQGAIVHVEPRTSFLSRKEHLHRREMQLIATNIDQVLITVSVVEPHLKPAIIDRYIIATYKGNMEPLLLINKIDLLKEDNAERMLYEAVTTYYRNLNLTVIPMSVQTGLGMDALKAAMKGKASVFAGQSGVGKSSLINAITGLTLPTRGVAKTGKGAHTTSTAHLIPLPFGGWCIDTPGIRSFGVWELTKEELPSFFPDLQTIATHCKYSNCTHLHEPGCAVQAAVQADKIPTFRYESYLKLLEEVV